MIQLYFSVRCLILSFLITIVGLFSISSCKKKIPALIPQELPLTEFNLSFKLVNNGRLKDYVIDHTAGTITIFAFNEQGIFEQQFFHQYPNFGANYSFPLALKRGKYTLVACVGYLQGQLKGEKLVPGSSHIDHLFLSSYLTLDGKKQLITTPFLMGTLYHVDPNDAPKVVQLKKLIMPLNLKIKGLTIKNKYRIQINNNSKEFQFDSNRISFFSDEHVSVTELIHLDSLSNSISIKQSLLWPVESNDTKLIVTNLTINKEVFKGNIKALLAKAFQSEQYFEELALIITLDEDFSKPTMVTINGWNVLGWDAII